MKNKGLAHMGIGRGKGENKTIEAVRQAVQSPLLETTIEGATGILLNVKGGLDLPIDEVDEAAALVKEVVDPEEVITTLACLLVQITLYSKKLPTNKEIFQREVRAEEITRVLNDYYSSGAFDSCLALLRLLKSDLSHKTFQFKLFFALGEKFP